MSKIKQNHERECVIEYMALFIMTNREFNNVLSNENKSFARLLLKKLGIVSSDGGIIELLYEAKASAILKIAEDNNVNADAFLQGVMGGDASGDSTKDWAIAVCGDGAAEAYEQGEEFAKSHGLAWNEQ